MKVRLKAIGCALYYSILPWWMYESKKHYSFSYWRHLRGNIDYACRWLTFQEDDSDRQFEKEVNSNF